MTNVTTKYKTTGTGAGRIIATGAGKQKTIPYDHSRSVDQNHGDAAGTLLRVLVRPERRGFVAATAKHETLPDGRHRFGYSI